MFDLLVILFIGGLVVLLAWLMVAGLLRNLRKDLRPRR